MCTGVDALVLCSNVLILKECDAMILVAASAVALLFLPFFFFFGKAPVLCSSFPRLQTCHHRASRYDFDLQGKPGCVVVYRWKSRVGRNWHFSAYPCSVACLYGSAFFRKCTMHVNKRNSGFVHVSPHCSLLSNNPSFFCRRLILPLFCSEGLSRGNFLALSMVC